MTASAQAPRLAPSPSERLRSALELLSSMRFAIALLTVICIASVIGTIVKQHEPVVNYVNQFGPFWSQLFLAIKLNAVYSAWWFLLILAFLVVSTSLCIARNTPRFIADMRSYKENIREQSLQAFHHRGQGMLPDAPADAARRIGQGLVGAGWKVRLQQRATPKGEGWMVAAKAGGANKIGYIAAHSAIVLVCLGGLLDGDLIVRAQMWFGDKAPYTGGGMIADVADKHRLAPSNPTFRGNLLVTEGTQSGTAILSQSDGILLQELPFSIELKKFVIEHYSTGMPKLFASDIVIHDHQTGEKVPARVEVNHPVSWRGIEIYQSSFDDGGSRVKLAAVPMDGSGKRFEVEGVIGGSTQLTRAAGQGSGDQLTLEYTGLRVINVENMADGNGSGVDPRKVDLRESITARLGAADRTVTKKELRNVGPSITYKLRDTAGQAREFHNYMLPVDLGEGVPLFLLGMRENPSDAFRYLRVPADAEGSMEGFLRLRAGLADPAQREEAVRRYARKATDPARPEVAQQLVASASQALALFAGDPAAGGKGAGLASVSEYLESRVPEAERSRAGEVVVRILGGVLYELVELGREQAGLKPLEPGERTQAFMAQSLLALGDAHLYPAPMAFELKDFQQVQASVFQVTRSPGRNVVYLGCALLIFGIFAMLYVRERRLWVWLGPAASGSEATMALSSSRKTLETDREFDRLRNQLLGSP